MNFLFTTTMHVWLLLALLFVPQVNVQQINQNSGNQQEQLEGAWQLVSGPAQFTDLPKGMTAVAMLEDGYFTIAYFDKATKRFAGTYGGTYTATDGKLVQKFEYNTLDSANVGTTEELAYTLQDGQLQLKGTAQGGSLQQAWTKIEPKNPTSPIEGTWRITGRAGQDGTISPMRRGSRKTLKILSDNRFQWIAFNTETKQFSGTGGGTYTAENGKYTENIEFFSRDPNRVGASLSFNYDVKDGKWHHTGKSSTGNNIFEVWERE